MQFTGSGQRITNQIRLLLFSLYSRDCVFVCLATVCKSGGDQA